MDPLKIELVLDGISRMGNERPPDFGSLTSSILKRAKRQIEKSDSTLLNLFSKLLLVWITKVVPKSVDDEFKDDSAIARFYEERIQMIIDRLMDGVSVPLLCTPTHEFGWLGVKDFQARFKQLLDAAPDQVHFLDITIALLRIKGSSLKPIIANLNELKDAQLPKQTKNTVSKALKVIAELEECDGAAGSAKKKLQWSVKHEGSGISRYAYFEISPPSSIVFPGTLGAEFKQNPNGYQYENQDTEMALLNGTITPLFDELYYATGVSWLASAIHSVEAHDKRAQIFFQPFYDRTRCPREFGLLLLAIGLSTGDHDLSVAACDALVALIEDSRLDFKTLATILRKLFQDEKIIKLARWAKQFSEVARASATHALTVFAIFETILPSSDNSTPKDLHLILEMLIEIKAEHNLVLQEPCSSYFGSLKVSGKTKQLIAQIRS